MMSLFCGLRDASRRLVALIVATLACAALPPAYAQSPEILPQLTLIVPAAAGGGLDLTALAMKHALERHGIAGHVDIERFPGAGGLIGLQQFVDRYRGRGDALLVGGLVLMSSAMRDEAAVSLRDVSPLARLSGEWSVIAVRRNSPLHTVADLQHAMKQQPGEVHWLGGALKGPDQGLVWIIAEHLGIPLDEIPYYGRAGGKRVSDALVEGHGDIGVSGYAEFAPLIRSGELRVLAVASPARMPGIAAPTLREAGLDATMMNWRAVFAAPDITALQRDRLNRAIAALVVTPTWSEELVEQRWTSNYLSGAGFAAFLDRAHMQWVRIVTPPARVSQMVLTPPYRGVSRTVALLLALFALAGFAIELVVRLTRRRRAGFELERRCSDLSDRLELASVSTGASIKHGIETDFDDWHLSCAESDIAWFMLRGLPLREIADLRGTSERTVRQQAQAIYRKAGLDGRSDLAGRVLERFI